MNWLRRLHHDPVLIIGLLLSVALGVFLYFVSDTSFVLGTLVSLVGTALALQLDLVMRVERKLHKEDAQSQLMCLLEQIPWLPAEVKDIAVSLNTVSALENQDGYLLDVARKALDECARTLDDLTRGQIRVSSDDNEALFVQTARAKEYILATSIPYVDLKWWCSDIGRKYWDANVAAMGRGVRVERVFVYQEWTDQLQELAEEQAAAGAIIWAVHRDKVPHALRIDMIVWDRSFSYEIRLNSDGEEIENLYSVNASDIDRKIHCFDIIRSCARRIDPPVKKSQPLQAVKPRPTAEAN